MFIVSFYSSINLNESIWELSFFCGWIALYYLFRAYSTQAVIKSIFLTTAIASFFVCIPSLINYNNNFYNRLEAPFNWEDKAIHKIHFLNPKGDSDIVTVFGESPNHVGLNSINVKKNKIYTFSFWVRALKSKRQINPALSININDNVIEQHFEIDTDWKFVHISKKFSELKPDDSPRAFFCYRDTSSIGFMVWGEKVTSGNVSSMNSYPNKLKDSVINTLKNLTFNLPGNSKIASTFGNNNFLGMFFCFSIPAIIGCLLLYRNKYLKWFLWISLFITIICLIYTRSRASWLGVGMGLMFLLPIISVTITKLKINLKNLFVILLTILSFYHFSSIPRMNTSSKNTIMSTFNSSINILSKEVWKDRLIQYSSTLEMITDHWLLGVGLGQWRIHYPKYSGFSVNNENFLRIRQRPHNDFLWIFSEIGLIGFILLLFFFINHNTKGAYIRKIWKGNYSEVDIINFIIYISLISISINALLDFPKQRIIPNLFVFSYMGYISSQLTTNTNKSLSTYLLIIIFFIVSTLSILDCYSNYYTKNGLFYKANLDHHKSVEFFDKANFCLKNTDYTGTPIDFYQSINYFNLKNYQQSKNLLEKAYIISPYNVGILANLTMLSNKDDAFLYYLKFKEIYPNLSILDNNYE